MSAPKATLALAGGTTLVRLTTAARMTPQQARTLALELLETADLADQANGVTPKAAPFVPATPDSIDDTPGSAR